MERLGNLKHFINACLLVLMALATVSCSDSYKIDLEVQELEQSIKPAASKIVINEDSSQEIKFAFTYKTKDEVTLNFEIDNSGGDFDKSFWTENVPKGSKEVTVSLEALSDNTLEEDEEFLLTVSDPSKTILKKVQSFTVTIPAIAGDNNNAPLINISAPANSGLVNSTNVAAFPVSGTCDEAGKTIVFSHGVANINCDGTNFSGNIDFSGVAEGDFSLSATLTDDNAQTGTSNSVSLDKDSVAPTVAIAAPSSTVMSSDDTITFPLTFSGSTSINLTTADITLVGDTTDCTKNVSNGTTSTPTVSITACSSADGQVQIRINAAVATDSHSNPSTQSDLSDAITLFNGGVPFVSVWTFPSDNYIFTIPIKDGFNYNFTVDWGDASPLSTITSFADLDKIHTYVNSGTYTITITGLCESFDNSGVAHRSQLIEVTDLGHTNWRSFGNAFKSNTNLVVVAGGNTSNVTNMASMFYSASSATPDTSGWDTSKVTNMFGMFSGATDANPNVTNWDTSKVTRMDYLFRYVPNATPNVTNWDTSSLEKASHLFNGASSATPNVTNWNTSNITDMDGMFYNATSATPNVTNWDTSKVTDMSDMFYNATSATPDVTNWDTSKVEDMSSMFRGATSATPNVINWDTSNVTDMSGMFMFITSDPDVSNFDTAKVTDMSSMFRGATIADPDVTNFNTSMVDDMGEMFRSAPNANPDVTGFDTAKVTAMDNMFNGATSAAPDVTGFDTTKVRKMNGMFSYITSDPDLSSFDTTEVTDMSSMFRGATVANPDVSEWNTSKVINMSYMFNSTGLANPDVSDWDTSKVKYLDSMFNSAAVANPNVTDWDTSEVIRMASLFADAPFANPDVTGWNTSKTTRMYGVFDGAVSATPNVTNWDMSKVTTIQYMFNEATAANPDVSNWVLTSLTSSATYTIDECGFSTENYSKFLIKMDEYSVSGSNVPMSVPAEYSAAAAAARTNLVNNLNWNLTDNGQEAP